MGSCLSIQHSFLKDKEIDRQRTMGDGGKEKVGDIHSYATVVHTKERERETDRQTERGWGGGGGDGMDGKGKTYT